MPAAPARRRHDRVASTRRAPASLRSRPRARASPRAASAVRSRSAAASRVRSCSSASSACASDASAASCSASRLTSPVSRPAASISIRWNSCCGGLAAFARLGDLHGEPLDLGAAGVEPGSGGVDLPGQPGEPLPAVGRGPLGLGDPPLLGGRGALGRHATGLGVREGVAGGLHLPAELELLGAQGRGPRPRSAPDRVRSPPPRARAAGAARARPTAAPARGSARAGRSGRTRSPAPSTARGASSAACSSAAVSWASRAASLGVDLGLALAQRRLVRDLRGQGLAQVHAGRRP